MPRLPVDGERVVEHRITFGTKERDMIEGALAAYQFNRVTTPIVAGMSDISFMVVVAGILTAIFPEIIIPTGVSTIDEVIDAIVAGIKQNREANPDNTFDIQDRGFWQYLFEEATILGRIFT